MLGCPSFWEPREEHKLPVLRHMLCGPWPCRFNGLTKPVLFETVLMGPQLLRDAYGAESVQLRTLVQIATHMIADLRAKLQAAYDDRVLVQVRGGAHCSCSDASSCPSRCLTRDVELRLL